MKSSLYFLALLSLISCSQIKEYDERKKEENENKNTYTLPRALELKEKSNVEHLSSQEAFELGKCYDNGTGINIDHDEAFKWYAYAIENDETGTKYCNIALMMSEDASLLPKQQKPWALLHEKYCH